MIPLAAQRGRQRLEPPDYRGSQNRGKLIATWMPKIIIDAIPAFLVLLMAEAIAGAILRRDLYGLKDTAASLTMGIGNLIVQ